MAGMTTASVAIAVTCLVLMSSAHEFEIEPDTSFSPIAAGNSFELLWNISFPFRVVRKVMVSACGKRTYAFITNNEAVFLFTAVDTDTGTVLWETSVFAGEPEVAYDVTTDVLLFASYIRVVGINGINGTQRWVRNISYCAGNARLANSSLLGKQVYVVDNYNYTSQRQELLALDPLTGSKVWTGKLPTSDVRYTVVSPMTSNQYHIFGLVGDDTNIVLVAFNLTTGLTEWTVNYITGNYSSIPFLHASQIHPVLYLGMDDRVRAFLAHGGHEIWYAHLGKWFVNDFRLQPRYNNSNDVVGETLLVSQNDDNEVQVVAFETSRVHTHAVATILWNTTVGSEDQTTDTEVLDPLANRQVAALAHHRLLGIETNNGTPVWSAIINNVRSVITDVPLNCTGSPNVSQRDRIRRQVQVGSSSIFVDTMMVNITAGTGSVRYNRGFAGTLVRWRQSYSNLPPINQFGSLV